MALLTKEAEDKVINLLLNEGLVDPALVQAVQKEAIGENKSVLAELIDRKIISNDMVAHATAIIISVPYVEL